MTTASKKFHVKHSGEKNFFSMHIKIKAASSQDETAFIYAIIRELLLQFFLVQCKPLKYSNRPDSHH